MSLANSPRHGAEVALRGKVPHPPFELPLVEWPDKRRRGFLMAFLSEQVAERDLKDIVAWVWLWWGAHACGCTPASVRFVHQDGERKRALVWVPKTFDPAAIDLIARGWAHFHASHTGQVRSVRFDAMHAMVEGPFMRALGRRLQKAPLPAQCEVFRKLALALNEATEPAQPTRMQALRAG